MRVKPGEDLHIPFLLTGGEYEKTLSSDFPLTVSFIRAAKDVRSADEQKGSKLHHRLPARP
jgi:hypothetical protein